MKRGLTGLRPLLSEPFDNLARQSEIHLNGAVRFNIPFKIRKKMFLFLEGAGESFSGQKISHLQPSLIAS